MTHAPRLSFTLSSFSGLALPLLLASGCASTTKSYAPSAPATVFPTRAEVSALPSETAKDDVFATSEGIVDHWQSDAAPAPDDDASPWAQLARDLVKPYAPHAVIAPALRCAAHEMARFELANKTLPFDGLRRFMIARCGWNGAQVSALGWRLEIPNGVSDAKILEQAREHLTKLAAEHLSRGEHALGMATVREKGNLALVVALGADDAVLAPDSRAVDSTRHVTLRGQVHGDYEAVSGFANRGAMGVGFCESNPKVRLPKFEMTCELAPGDVWDWVAVVGRKKGRLLEESLSEVIVYAGDGSGIEYHAQNFGAPALVSSGADLSKVLLERLNVARTRAKLAPVTLAAKQSIENTRLVGTLLDGSLHTDASADRAALGLLAGWDVEGMIRSGHFFVGSAAPTRDATVWLATATEHPLGRMVLFDPDVRQIAIGPTLPKSAQALGAAVTTYALFDSAADHREDASRFFKHVADERWSRGLPAAERVGGLEELDREAAHIKDDGKAPMAALHDALDAAVKRTGRSIQGYVFETNDLAHADVPKELLSEGPLDVALVVTHHRAAEAAWGQYVVLVIVFPPGSTQEVKSARADRPRTG